MSSDPTATRRLRAQIRASVDRHAPLPGSTKTALEGVELFRVVSPFERMPGIYRPSVCVIVSGEKVVHVEGVRHVFNEDRLVCATLPTPVLADVPKASPDSPLLGVVIPIDAHAMSQLVLETQVAYGTLPSGGGATRGFDTAARDARFDTALANLLALLDDPPAIQVIGAARLRELRFALLRGEAGDRLRSDFGAAPALATTLAHVHAHIGEDTSIDALARRAGMSRAAFGRQFKAATAQSPLQYIKALRLNEASMLIARGARVSEAAARVGYHNASQFSREFRRKFGASPRAWAREARSAAVTAE